jgi:hypothetical protein
MSKIVALNAAFGLANASANSAADYCSAVAAAAVAVVANQAVAAAGAASSTAVHSGSVDGRIAEPKPPALRSPAGAAGIPEAWCFDWAAEFLAPPQCGYRAS